MDYKNAVDYIHSRLKFGSVLGLDNMRGLLNLLGNPQKNLKFIHIAGTNGKGSTAVMTSFILTEAGFKTGLFTSPFIHHFNERICTCSENILDASLAKHTSLVKEAVDKMELTGKFPTEFEIITAIAMSYFSDEKCDFVVFEVGLGGRLDATNIIENPVLSVITNIGIDHSEYLGSTIKEISAEKCGIIKNAPVISYPQDYTDATEVIKNTCEKNFVHLITADKNAIKIHESGLMGSEFDYKNHKNVKISLIGEHQIKNAITVLEIIDALNLKISEDIIKKGIFNSRWSGRMEILRTDPIFIVDGAHNFSGVSSLYDCIKKNFKDKKLSFIIGMLADKEVKKCMELICPLAEEIFTVDVPNGRTMKKEELKKIAEVYCKNVIGTDIKTAVLKAKYDTVAFGSLYMTNSITNAALNK